MDKDYDIIFDDHPEQSAWGIIGQGIDRHNLQQGGEYHFQRLCFVLRAPDGETAGGVIGEMYWNWLYISLMWVKDELRGQGYGHRLLMQVEDEARRRGAKQVYLDTFSFQAPGFYKKYGYRVFGELPDFPAGHQRFFMTKEL